MTDVVIKIEVKLVVDNEECGNEDFCMEDLFENKDIRFEDVFGNGDVRMDDVFGNGDVRMDDVFGSGDVRVEDVFGNKDIRFEDVFGDEDSRIEESRDENKDLLVEIELCKYAVKDYLDQMDIPFDETEAVLYPDLGFEEVFRRRLNHFKPKYPAAFIMDTFLEEFYGIFQEDRPNADRTYYFV